MLAFIATLLQACALWSQPKLADLRLPSHHALNCCWQSSEVLTIQRGEQSFQLQAATVVEPGALRVFVFDPLGRKLLDVAHSGGEYTIEKAAHLPETLPIDWMLPAVLMSHARVLEWPVQVAAWHLRRDKDTLLLEYRGRQQLSVMPYTDGRMPAAGEQRRVVLPAHNTEITITTITASAL